MSERVAVTIIYNEDGKVLSLRRSNSASDYSGFWNFPGGGVEKGESPAIAAAREAFEESGLRIDPDHLHFMGEFPMGNIIIYYFTTRKYNGDVCINNESSDFQWINPREITERHFLPIPSTVLNIL